MPIPTFKDVKTFMKTNTKAYEEGLFALVVALLTFGLERILDKEAFKCPRTGYQAYAIAFFACPIVMLTLLNLLTLPAEGGTYIWSICERSRIQAYHRRGDCFAGFFSALCIGFVAPVAWAFLSLLNGQHLVCWELGYQFGDNVTESYLDYRGFGNCTIQQYEDKIHEAKAKSNTIAVIVLSVAVVCLFLVIIVRRSCLKPFDVEKRLKSLCHFERREAFAAREELNRLLSEGDEFPDTALLLQFLVIKERIISLEKELKETQTDEKKTAEIKQEVEEFKELDTVLHFWVEWYRLDKKKLAEDSKTLVADAKSVYESRRDKLLAKRTERIDAAKTILKEYEKPVDGDVSSAKTTEAIHQAWLFSRLEQQKSLFDIDDLMKRWESAIDDVKRLKRGLYSQLQNGFMECPEVRGRAVAQYVVQLYKDKNDYCWTLEQLLEKFGSIYPRVATSDPALRHVNVDSLMYNHIVDNDGKEPWNEDINSKWVEFMWNEHKHSCLPTIFCCGKPYCSLGKKANSKKKKRKSLDSMGEELQPMHADCNV